MTSPVGTNQDGETSGSEAAGDNAIPAGPTVLGARSPGSRRRSRPRRSRRSRSRRSRSWRAAFFALALLGVVGAAAWTLLGPWLLVVRSVVVTGTHLVPTSQVLAVAGIREGTPLIRVNTARAAARIETIRQVASAQVTRSWPDRVVITVRERTPVVAVTAPGGGFDLMDGDGVIVRWAARHPASLPLYVTAASVTSLPGDPDLAATAAVLAGLPAKLRASIQSVTAPSPDQVTLRLAGGVTVLWGSAGDARAKAEELALLMPGHKTYYDVSAPANAVTN